MPASGASRTRVAIGTPRLWRGWESEPGLMAEAMPGRGSERARLPVVMGAREREPRTWRSYSFVAFVDQPQAAERQQVVDLVDQIAVGDDRARAPAGRDE